MQAIIMAGGFGTRLRPLTSIIPKPMVPVVNKPMMEYVVTLLKKYGIEDLIVMLFFQHEFITNYFSDGSKYGVKIKYLLPEVDLGTCGSVGYARKHIKDDNFLVISADIITDFNLEKFYNFHLEKNAIATIALTSVENPLSYGIVFYNEDGRVTRFLEKPTWGEVFSDKINTGIYMLNKKIFDLIPENRLFDFSKDLFPKLLENKLPLYACALEGYWKDVGTLLEYRFCHYDVLEGKIKISIEGEKYKFKDHEITIGKNTTIGENFNCDKYVIIGSNTKIGNKVKINKSVIGNNCIIEDNCVIFGSVIMDNVYVGRYSSIKEDVIAKGTKIGKNSVIEVNTVVGENCDIGDGALVKANLKIWPKKTVEEGAILSTSLIWQEKWSQSLFGSSGISGLLNVEITPEFAAKLGAALGSFFGKGKYVITSRDSHRASRMIKRTIISGLMSSGAKVGDLRTTPMPVVRYELGMEGDAGGIHVRMSPRKSEVVEIKLFDKNGYDISVAQEKSIEQLFLREDFPRARLDEIGEIVLPHRANEYYKTGYLKALDLSVIKNSRLKVVIDYSYSSAVGVFTSILGEMGIEVVSLNAYEDPAKIFRTENELNHDLEQLSDIVKILKADAGFLINNSAEKVFFVDNKGEILKPQLSLMILVSLLLKTYDKQIPIKITVPMYVSSVIKKIVSLRKSNVEIIWSKTLPRHITDESKKSGVKFASDGLGGFIFPEFQPAFDAMFSIGKTIEFLAKSKTTLSKLRKKIPEFNVEHRKIPCPWDKKGFIIRKLVEEYNNKNIELTDGVKLWLNDNDWILFIPDADDAFMHIYAETQRNDHTAMLLDENIAKLKLWLKD